VLVRLLLRFLRSLSRENQRALARFVANLVWTLRIRRGVTLDNLRHAYPDAPASEHLRIARAAYASMALAAIESVTSDQLRDDELQAVVSVTDWKGLDALFDGKKAVLLASAHLGSWEFFAEVMARRGVALTAVVRPLSGAFNQQVIKSRLDAGVELIFQRGALRKMLAALKRNRAVVQLIDQALPSPQALWVPFFGRPASTTPALSMAALHTGAPVYVLTAVRSENGLQMNVDGPVPFPSEGTRAEQIAAHTATLTRLIEERIRANPEQWLWLHRRWKGAPPAHIR
jgi:KDO2-lipid IV(A) lauroyltransferase